MVAQGVLDFQYEADSSHHGLTSLAGLPVYFELLKASGLGGLGNGGRMILQLRSSRESTQGFQIVRTLPGSIRPTKAGPGLRLPWIGGFRNLREEIMATGPLRIDQFVLVRAHLPVRRFGNPVVAPGR